MMEATKGIVWRCGKGSTKDSFLFDSWLSSNNLAEYSMEVGGDLNGMVKTNTTGLYKETIENLTKDWRLGYYLVLSSKHVLPGGRPIIDIGYKYNAQEFIST